GLQKPQVGVATTISWRSDGLTAVRPVALIDAGGPAAGAWSADAYRTDVSGYAGTLSSVVDTSGVSDPAPQAVYQSYAQANYGTGQGLSYLLPVPDGAYTVRLHFAEPAYYYAGGRVFDVRLQGTTVRAGYDIFADAGATNRATALSFAVAATGGQGIKIE